MKSIEDILLQRTSVRRYERRKIEPEKLEFIYNAIRNTPTSYNGQQFSVIAIDDQNLKEELYSITGQKQIKTSAIFLVFCADFHKIKIIADSLGIEFPEFTNTADGYTVGVIDAALAMQNAVNAALGLGLGCCCIGYTRTAAPEKIAELLKLPQNVCVVCGLAIGYPNEWPDLKPKQPLPLLIHQNHYRTDDMTDELKEYNQTIIHYNQTRSGTTTTNDWASHMVDYYKEAMNYKIKEYLKSQGFDIKK